MMDISIVIPVYNGSKSLSELCERIQEVCGEQGWTYEILLIDDQSRDDSWQVMKELKAESKAIQVYQNTCNKGQQRTILEGLAKASGHYVVTMDDDLEHLPESIPNLLNELVEKRLDLVYGVVEFREGKRSLYRQMGSKMRDQLFKYLFGKNTPRKLSSFRVFDRRLVNELTMSSMADSQSFVYVSAMALSMPIRAESVQIQRSARKYGASNYNWKNLSTLYLKILWYYHPWNVRFKAWRLRIERGKSHAIDDAGSR